MLGRTSTIGPRDRSHAHRAPRTNPGVEAVRSRPGDPGRELFWRLLERWRDEVHGHGARFTVMTLPRVEEGLSGRILAARFDVLNLLDELDASIDDYSWEGISFERDAPGTSGATPWPRRTSTGDW